MPLCTSRTRYFLIPFLLHVSVYNYTIRLTNFNKLIEKSTCPLYFLPLKVIRPSPGLATKQCYLHVVLPGIASTTSKAKCTAKNRKIKDCQVCIHTLIIIIIMIIACSTMYLTLILLLFYRRL